MKTSNPLTLAVDALKFDEFGDYEIKEVLTDDALDLISGGFIITNKCEVNKDCERNNGCKKYGPYEDDDSNLSLIHI